MVWPRLTAPIEGSGSSEKEPFELSAPSSGGSRPGWIDMLVAGSALRERIVLPDLANEGVCEPLKVRASDRQRRRPAMAVVFARGPYPKKSPCTKPSQVERIHISRGGRLPCVEDANDRCQ